MTVPLHLAVSGASSAPAIVLLHAIATSGAMWRPQVEALVPAYRVIVPDLPGHGRSAPFATGATFGDYAEAVLAALDRLGVARASFVGLSFGSMVAQAIAAGSPGRVSALVLSNGVAFAPDPVLAAWGDRIAGAERDGMPAQVDATLDRWFTPAFRADPAVAPIGRLVAETPVAGYVCAARAIATLDNRALLPRIAAPTLVLAGDADAAAPKAAVASIADAIPGAAFASLPAGHLMNIESAQAYNRLILDFLASVHQAQG